MSSRLPLELCLYCCLLMSALVVGVESPLGELHPVELATWTSWTRTHRGCLTDSPALAVVASETAMTGTPP